MKGSARQSQIIFACPRCGQKRTVNAIQAEKMITCPRCTAGMREQESH